MPNVLKVIEVLAESQNSWEDAAAMAVAKAAETVRSIKSIHIKDFDAQVDNNKITSYRINAQVSFMLWEAEQQAPESVVETTELNVQEGGVHGFWQDDALKRIIKQHPQKGIPQVEGIEPEEAPTKE
jgi:flavin-binding protein dodecin